VDRETAVAGGWVNDDAATVIKQELEDMGNAGTAGLTTRQPRKPFVELFIVIGNSLSDDRSLNNDQNGEDEEHNAEDSKLGKLTENDNPAV